MAEAVLKEWSAEAKVFYAKMRVEGLSQINAQEAVRVEYGISHIYKQGTLSNYEKRPDWHKAKVDYLVERQERFEELPYAKRYERISANAEMANALANRFWEEEARGVKANASSLVRYSSEFRQCLAAIKEDISGMGIEDGKGDASGFAQDVVKGLLAIANLTPDEQRAIGVSKEDLKGLKVN